MEVFDLVKLKVFYNGYMFFQIGIVFVGILFQGLLQGGEALKS